MAHVTSFWARATRSARGELFNPLIYPFLLTTLSYGVGFTAFRWTEAVSMSSLYASMTAIGGAVTLVWGILALCVIIVGLYVLVFDKPPVGRANCLVAWMLWAFAGMVYILTGGWITLFAVALPSLYFWTWQYFSLAKFKHQDTLDNRTMERYDTGQYDNADNPTAARDRRENRGVDPADRDIRS